MTVEELIDKLKQYPAHLEVRVDLTDGDYTGEWTIPNLNPNILDVKDVNINGVRYIDILPKERN